MSAIMINLTRPIGDSALKISVRVLPDSKGPMCTETFTLRCAVDSAQFVVCLALSSQ